MKPLIHDPKNLKAIETLWVWLSVDEDDNEGICSTGIIDDETGAVQHMPLVTGDPLKVGMLQAVADDICKYTKKSIVRAEFKRTLKDKK